MNNDHIFNDYIDLTDIEAFLNEIELEDGVKEELITVVHKTIHIEIINLALSELPADERVNVAHYLEHRSHDKGLLVYLRRSIDRFEDRVRDLVHVVKLDFKDSLHDYKDATKEWLSGEST